jgi:hypothetical protein
MNNRCDLCLEPHDCLQWGNMKICDKHRTGRLIRWISCSTILNWMQVTKEE